MKNIDTILNGHRVLNLANNTNLEKTVICLISSSESTTLSAINELIVERKKAGADPTPLDLGEEKFTPFVFKKGEDLVDVSSSSGYESDREGIYLTGSNANGAYVINVQKTGNSDKDRRLVITGPGAFLAGQYWFPESVSEEDTCYSISSNLFVDTDGSVFFLDYYNNPERYVIPLIHFMKKHEPEVTSATFFYKDDLNHGFDIKILFTTNPDGSRTGNVFSYTVTDLGKLEPVVKIHYGRFDDEKWKEDINLPQSPSDLRAFKDCLLRRNTIVESSAHSNFEKVLLELLDILLFEDRSVDIAENGSYKIKDSFSLIFHYFDQDSFPSEWVPLFNDKLKIKAPVVTAGNLRRWTGIDDIPYEVPITVIPYRFGVYLMNKTDKGYLGPFEDTESVVLSDFSDQYPSLKKVDLHNTVWFPKRSVMVKINKKAVGKSRLCTLDMLDTSSNCSTGKEFPYETTLGEVEEGYTFYFSKPDGSEPRWAREEVLTK